jgi:dTDP-4-dehydrorhamnose reductase
LQQNKAAMKVLILGASGLIGSAACAAAVRRGHQVCVLRHQTDPVTRGIAESYTMDATNLPMLTQAIIDLWPDAIINAAALSSPESVDAQPELAEKINVAVPRQLAQLSTHLGTRLIHLSTDMVFDGVGGQAYRSTDLPNPTNLYGQLKLMAEREVLEHNPEDPVVLRVTLTMGNSPGGRRSVHEKLLHSMASGQRVRMATDEIRQPVSAENLAEVMVELIERRDLHGIFHWAGTETLTRYDLACRILRAFRLPESLVEPYERHADVPGGREWSMVLPPLLGKLRNFPASIATQVEELVVPADLQPWYQKQLESIE